MSGYQKGRNTVKAGVGPGVSVVEKLLPLQTEEAGAGMGEGVFGQRGMGPQT